MPGPFKPTATLPHIPIDYANAGPAPSGMKTP